MDQDVAGGATVTGEQAGALLEFAGLALSRERQEILARSLRRNLPHVRRLSSAMARLPGAGPVAPFQPPAPAGSTTPAPAGTASPPSPLLRSPVPESRDGGEPLRELCDHTVASASAAIYRGEISPVELVQAYLDRIAAVEGAINAFVTVLGEQALAAARLAERQRPAGPLHGIPIAVKDMIDVEGAPTTAGSRVPRSAVATRDATVVARLKSAGAVIIGKTNLDEFSRGGRTVNPLTGATRNPWDTSRIPGGSSGGSAAAVAARMCPAALGADTGGSVRLPAAMNGVVGLRPTQGVVSNTGAIPLAWTMDAIGPMARTAEDCALLLACLAGHDPLDAGSVACPPLAAGLEPLGPSPRVGVVDLGAAEPTVRAAVEDALGVLEGLGAATERVTVEHAEDRGWALLVIERCEPSAVHRVWLRERASEYGEEARAKLEEGEVYLATDYLHAQRYRWLLRGELLRAVDGFDALACPTVPFVAPRDLGDPVSLDDGTTVTAVEVVLRFTGLASLTGLPALSVPCGFSPEGMPVGLQLIGRPFGEARLLALAGAYQQATDWHRRCAPCR